MIIVKKKQNDPSEIFWSFGIINGRLAEFFFRNLKNKSQIQGHGYVKRSKYKTKREQKIIDEDTKKYHFTYCNEKYRRMKIQP